VVQGLVRNFDFNKGMKMDSTVCKAISDNKLLYLNIMVILMRYLFCLNASSFKTLIQHSRKFLNRVINLEMLIGTK